VGQPDKNWEAAASRFWGRGWERKKFTPHFLPTGGSGGPKFFGPRGLVGHYLRSKFDVPTLKIGGRGWLLPVSKNFH